MKIECFKSYDIRGVVGDQISEDIFYRIARALVAVLRTRKIAIGYDARHTSPSLAGAFISGALDEGSDVIDLELCGTEEVYFATSHYGADAGVMITASHNPIEFNGIKFVGPKSRPLDVHEEFLRIKEIAETLDPEKIGQRVGTSSIKSRQSRTAYATKVLSFIDSDCLSPLKVVINCGNGAAGPALIEVMRQITVQNHALHIVPFLEEPDSDFPYGVPNPILPENHHYTSDKVLEEKADFGVAFDGDFDRCFFFDSRGEFVPGEIMVGLLVEFFARKGKRERIVHDPRLIFNTKSVCEQAGAIAIQSQTGHLFMKQVMRKHRAIYGGEMSAHHYFRDFFYCDSGMIPWLLVCELLSRTGRSLGELVSARKSSYPSSGEINFKVSKTTDVLAGIVELYEGDCIEIDRQDGLSFLFSDWRFNLRGSNTEPLLRLNVETRGDPELLQRKVIEISQAVERLAK